MLGLLTAAVALTFAPPRPLPFTGTNLSGAEFGSVKEGVRSVFDKDYSYPNEAEVAYFTAKGMNVFRIPFRWERLQPVAKGEFDADEIKRLDRIVSAITKRKAIAILDPHNYARYYGGVIGGPKVTNADFADLWRRLADTFKNDKKVWFGLMNEPHDMPVGQWLSAANTAVAAVRATGAKNLVLVPGSSWTGAHSWISSGNDAMIGLKDSANNFAFEAHQYLDVDSSGSHPEVVSPTVGVERLKPFVDWCRKNRKRGFLGEFGVAQGEPQKAALENMLNSMERDRDVWLGFTWWSAGPWWGDYMFTIEPKDGKDRPQMETLRPHLQP